MQVLEEVLVGRGLARHVTEPAPSLVLACGLA